MKGGHFGTPDRSFAPIVSGPHTTPPTEGLTSHNRTTLPSSSAKTPGDHTRRPKLAGLGLPTRTIPEQSPGASTKTGSRRMFRCPSPSVQSTNDSCGQGAHPSASGPHHGRRAALAVALGLAFTSPAAAQSFATTVLPIRGSVEAERKVTDADTDHEGSPQFDGSTYKYDWALTCDPDHNRTITTTVSADWPFNIAELDHYYKTTTPVSGGVPTAEPSYDAGVWALNDPNTMVDVLEGSQDLELWSRHRHSLLRVARRRSSGSAPRRRLSQSIGKLCLQRLEEGVRQGQHHRVHPVRHVEPHRPRRGPHSLCLGGAGQLRQHRH